MQDHCKDTGTGYRNRIQEQTDLQLKLTESKLLVPLYIKSPCDSTGIHVGSEKVVFLVEAGSMAGMRFRKHH